MLGSYKRQPVNPTIIDLKTGDVNGDGIPDTVFLVGEKEQYSWYQSLKLVIRDGRTMLQYVIPLLPGDDKAIDPWLYLGSFKGLKVNEILVNMPVGGSGGLTFYYIVSFLNNQAVFMLTPDEFQNFYYKLDFKVIFRDFYKVDITSEQLQQTFTLDISYKKDVYEGVIYNKDGTLIKPMEGMIIGPTTLYPRQYGKDARTQIMVYEDIGGTSHADGLGNLVSYWEYSDQQKMWTFIRAEVVIP